MRCSPVVRNETSPSVDESVAAPEAPARTEITMSEFENDLRFNRSLRKAVLSLNFENFTPVQQRAIIPFMQKNGVVCKAKTGTGKTLSFVIPLFNRCLEDINSRDARGSVRGLIIAPTRDLARQIYEDIYKLSTYNQELKKHVTAALWCGGTQTRMQRGPLPLIIVGTPGRILDNLRTRGRDFARLEYRVFDEADRLLDQGFEKELYDIDAALQQVRDPQMQPLKNALFSATVDDTVMDFAREQIGRDFEFINCVAENEAESHKAIAQELIETDSLHDSVSEALNHMVSAGKDLGYKAILFLPTKVFAERMYYILRDLSKSRNIWRLHGAMSQSKRDRTTMEFKRAKGGVLVCTDVAARGMDFKNITEVLQVGVSRDPADYIHKIGRTGRAGALGNAKLYLSTPEMPFARTLEQKLGIEFESTRRLMPQDVELVFDQVSVHPDEAEDQTMSLIGAQKSIADSYRLDKHLILKDVIELYRAMIGDTSAKFYMSANKFNLIGLPPSLVPDHVEVDNLHALKRRGPGRRDMRQQFARGTRRGGFDSYGSHRYDRFSSYRNDNPHRSRGSNNYPRDLDSYSNSFYKHGSNNRDSKKNFD